jgi:hypothetical protein
MADIVDLNLAKASANDPLFKAVWQMEADLRAIDEFADALTLVSETMVESPHANAMIAAPIAAPWAAIAASRLACA